MKTTMSRFTIHDDLSAPEGSLPVLRGALSTRRSAAELPRRAGRIAGRAARLRALPRGAPPRHARRSPTLERISLAVAEQYGSAPGIALHSRTARSAGLGLDEVAKAREFDSGDPKQAALLRYLKAALEGHGGPPDAPPRGGARGSAGTTRSCSRRSRTRRSRSSRRWSTSPATCPIDGSVEESRTLRAA